MKAVVYHRYGTPDELEMRDVEVPVPGPDEVLVRVHAVSLNASDWEFLTGSPFYARIIGLRKPKRSILGSDIAGRVAAVGSEVTGLAPGDAVFGDIMQRLGGFAEYVCAPASALLRKPESMTFAQAAALPQGACIALQGIRDHGHVEPGHRVLINGAGGSGGSFAVQLAKHHGAEVTGVDHTDKLEMMRSLGADHVVDYTREDVTRHETRYDLILDLVGRHSIFAFKRILGPKGRYLCVGGSMSILFQTLLLGSLISLFGRKRMKVLAVDSNKGLSDIVALIDAGAMTPMIDRTFSLAEVPEALGLLGQGRIQGKAVILVAAEDAV